MAKSVLIMDRGASLAHCERCGAVIPRPARTMPIDDLIDLMARIAGEHERCQPPAPEQEG